LAELFCSGPLADFALALLADLILEKILQFLAILFTSSGIGDIEDQ